MYRSYSQKRIIKGAKFHSQNFGGLARTLLKRCYRTTIIWYAKLAPTRSKCFKGSKCVSSQPTNHQLTYDSSHNNINPIPRWAVITTVCMQTRGSMILNSQFLTPRTVMQRHPIQKKLQYSLIFQRRKWGSHQNYTRVFPRSFSPNGRSQWRNRYLSTHGTDVEFKSEQLENNPTNPRSSKYKLHHKRKPNWNDDNRY